MRRRKHRGLLVEIHLKRGFFLFDQVIHVGGDLLEVAFTLECRGYKLTLLDLL